MNNPGLILAMIVALGAASQWLAWRINLPAILPLLLIGFMMGPVLGFIQPGELVGTDLLHPAVSLAVGLILFEGGLTLRWRDLKGIGTAVWRLVTVGGVVTWLLIALAAWLLVGLEAPMAIQLGALLMVTGPTVIGPLLRIVRPVKRVGNVLRWEGIVIDPIGAMVAALVFTWIVNSQTGNALGQTLSTFGLFIAVGSAVGVVAGYALAALLRQRLLPDYLVNVTSLAFVLMAFAVSNMLSAESGLLATTIMGIIIANSAVPSFRTILSFKEDLTVLVISVLFIILAADIELATLLEVTSLPSLVFLLVVMLVIRPASIFISTIGTSLSLKEKLYLSWIAPRGIVAASVSALFAARLTAENIEGAQMLVPLVFLVIVGTVLLNSLTALPVARWLGVAEPDPQGYLILGAHPFARAVGRYLREAGYDVMLADTNWSNVVSARADGLNTYFGSLLSDQADDQVKLSGIGKLLALTSNEEANALTALKYSRVFGSGNVYQLAPHHQTGARGNLGSNVGGRTLFRADVTFHDLRRLLDKGAGIVETQITEEFTLKDYRARYGGGFVPLFVRRNGDVEPLTENQSLPDAGTYLIALRLEAPVSAPGT